MRILLLFLISTLAFATPKGNDRLIRVAVIDTGFDFDSSWEGIQDTDNEGRRLRRPVLCKDGHTDFTGTGIKDNYGHGTHVAGIIAKIAEDSNYCLIILKFFDSRGNPKKSYIDTISSFKKAVDLKVDIINFSGGGLDKGTEECDLIKKALDNGIIVVAAAGNNKSNINIKPHYPAMCDKRVIAVGNIDDNGKRSPSSNYTDNKKNSRVLYVERGVNVLSLLPNNKVGRMTGTSQSTAVRTGKIIKNLNNK